MKIPVAGNVTPERAAPTGDQDSKAHIEEPQSESIEVSHWCESETPGTGAGRDQTLRLLARLLVKAARAPGLVTSPDPENPLDVAPAPEVVSKAG